MRLSDVPVLSHVFESGPRDRIFDSLLLAGPLVVVLLAVLGRSPLTHAVAASYIVTLVGYVLYRAVRNRSAR